MSKYLSVKNDEAVEQVLKAMIAFPEIERAKKYLSVEGREISLKQMQEWRDERFKDRFIELRRAHGPELEAHLADEMLENARRATFVEASAIRRTNERLAKNKVEDPARVARDLSQIRSQAIDKRLALEGRPQKITESRNVEELVNALVGMKVATIVDATSEETPALEAGDGPGT